MARALYIILTVPMQFQSEKKITDRRWTPSWSKACKLLRFQYFCLCFYQVHDFNPCSITPFESSVPRIQPLYKFYFKKWVVNVEFVLTHWIASYSTYFPDFTKLNTNQADLKYGGNTSKSFDTVQLIFIVMDINLLLVLHYALSSFARTNIQL